MTGVVLTIEMWQDIMFEVSNALSCQCNENIISLYEIIGNNTVTAVIDKEGKC